MGTTLEHGVYLPDEGERNCYAGLKVNWETLDQKVADISALQSAIAGALHREIVATLPTTDIDPNTIYMILSGTSATENVYNEFMYVNNAWELIGTSATDLTNYYTKGEIDSKLLLKASASDLTSHTGDTTIHVTASDKAKWDTLALIKHLRLVNAQVGSATTVPFSDFDDTNGIKVGDKCADLDVKVFEITAVDTTNETVTVGSALIDIALDLNVVHNSGAETIGGAKSFTDDTTVSLIKSVTNLATGSTTGSNILPLSATITYTDGTTTKTAKLNFRIQTDGSVALYPHENGIYSLGLVSRNWDNVFSYMFEAFGKNLGDEFSTNARTNLYLKANRDTGGKSGAYITRFRQNKAQGSLASGDFQILAIDFLENEVRTNGVLQVQGTGWVDDVPTKGIIVSAVPNYTFGSSSKPCKINDLEPSALGMPDLNNGVDISSYITVVANANKESLYTPPANGWISVRLSRTSGALDVLLIQGNMASSGKNIEVESGATTADAMLPVVGGVQVSINSALADGVVSAKFFPCLGNV